MGAQVGESGILSAAARVFAACNKPFENYEGSMNGFLLKQDVTSENLTVGFGGIGTLSRFARLDKYGFGFSSGRRHPGILGSDRANRST